jgi:phosphatidylserine/phosphatidylglycerophosphate/cardiolipin synthase-like enzyme
VHERAAGLGAAPSKLCVVDGVWCALGGTRLDGRAWLHEAAAGLVVLDPCFGARLEALFDAEAAQGADAPMRPGGGRAWIGQRFVPR